MWKAMYNLNSRDIDSLNGIKKWEREKYMPYLGLWWSSIWHVFFALLFTLELFFCSQLHCCNPYYQIHYSFCARPQKSHYIYIHIFNWIAKSSLAKVRLGQDRVENSTECHFIQSSESRIDVCTMADGSCTEAIFDFLLLRRNASQAPRHNGNDQSAMTNAKASVPLTVIFFFCRCVCMCVLSGEAVVRNERQLMWLSVTIQLFKWDHYYFGGGGWSIAAVLHISQNESW